MKIILSKIQADEMTSYVDGKLNESPCDHSLIHTEKWAELNGFDHDNLIDILEANGGFCDCEVVLNLPEDTDISLSIEREDGDIDDPWKIPLNFVQPNRDKKFSNLLVSRHSSRDKCYAKDDELLVPAPRGTKPKKRIRKSVHFFVGLETGLPNEYGFVQSCEPITAYEFAKMVRDSGPNGLQKFREREASFFLSRLDKIKPGNGVGTYFIEITGLTSKREEIKVHKIIFRK
ncbi:MAG: DUF2695 domain-containing protein [Bacteroidetes bacterium]|nr:DUF2695 domain-containing protein [Bacteroidota bacterium]